MTSSMFILSNNNLKDVQKARKLAERDKREVKYEGDYNDPSRIIDECITSPPLVIGVCSRELQINWYVLGI
jgi:hypothetical protein